MWQITFLFLNTDNDVFHEWSCLVFSNIYNFYSSCLMALVNHLKENGKWQKPTPCHVPALRSKVCLLLIRFLQIPIIRLTSFSCILVLLPVLLLSCWFYNTSVNYSKFWQLLRSLYNFSFISFIWGYLIFDIKPNLNFWDNKGYIL